MLNCRIYPNGEFSLWDEKKNLAVTPAPDQPDYLGLSLLPNSHRVALGMAVPPPERAKRGLKGITKHGARTVRNAAFLLEERYGVRNLSFVTCTLPLVDQSAEFNAGREWAEIVRIFCQSVGRLLVAAGLPPSYVGCTEIQMARYSKHGGLPLHLHLVVPGRHRFKTWAISCDQYRELWRRAVVSRCPEFSSSSWAASVDAQAVKQSAEGYLGKYMTKGVATLSALLADDPGLAEFLPSSWWSCSTNIRRAIGKRISGGLATAIRVIKDVRSDDSRIQWAGVVEVPMSDGSKVPVAVVGKLSAEGRVRYGWRAYQPPLGRETAPTCAP